MWMYRFRFGQQAYFILWIFWIGDADFDGAYSRTLRLSVKPNTFGA
jgi:hypothetical protein